MPLRLYFLAICFLTFAGCYLPALQPPRARYIPPAQAYVVEQQLQPQLQQQPVIVYQEISPYYQGYYQGYQYPNRTYQPHYYRSYQPRYYRQPQRYRHHRYRYPQRARGASSPQYHVRPSPRPRYTPPPRRAHPAPAPARFHPAPRPASSRRPPTRVRGNRRAPPPPPTLIRRRRR